MRKIFLNAAALSLALVTVTPALQSCKDYDDDITSINGVNDDLAKQILDLKKQVDDLSEAQKNAATAAANAANAAEAARQLADQALKAGNKAEAEALAAQATASDALAAAEKAKADALAALTKEAEALKALINANSSNITEATGNIAKNAEEIAKLDGKVAAIDSKLANYSTTAQMVEAINKAIDTNNGDINDKIDAAKADLLNQINALSTRTQAVETQQATLQGYITALESNYTALSGKLDGLSTKIDGQQTSIENLSNSLTATKNDLTSLSNKIDTAGSAISGLESELETIDGKLNSISSQVNVLESALNTLNAVNAKRLTSLTLVPTSYVGGIPSIEFYSASFKAWGELDAETGIYAAADVDAQPIIVTNNDTKVLYRLNPAGVTLNDIVPASVTFVQQTATSRAAETPVIKVVKVEKNDEGQLVVTATKADGVTTSIDNAGAGKIYTAALRVPIAPANYYSWKDENGNEVKESADDAVVYSEYSRIAESTFVPEIAWNKEYSENEEISHFWNTDIWTSDDIEAAIEVPYSMPDNGTFDLTTIVTGCMNDNGECNLMTAEQLASFGFTFEYSVPAKEYMIDEVNQQEYATVSADGKLTPVQPEGLTAASRVDKTPIISVVMKHGDDVIDQRFFKVKYVISAEDTTFDIDVFTIPMQCENVTNYVNWATFNKEVIEQMPFPISKEEFVSMYSWKNTDISRVRVDLNDEENPILFAVYVKDYQNMDGKNVDIEKEVILESNVPGFPEITIKLHGTVKWPENLPTLGATSDAYWNNGVMEIMPEAMPVPYVEGVTATYKTNILAGRFAPYITGFMPCANWDIQIKDINNGFKPGAVAPALEGDGAYKVMDGENTAASIWSVGDGEEAHTPFTLDGEDAAEEFKMFFTIENNEAGIKLVDQETPSVVSLGWYTFLNGKENGNSYALFNTELKVVAPLKQVNLAQGLSVIQNTTVQYLDLSKDLTITDCFNNTFGSDDSYWKYYDIEPTVDGEKQAIIWNNDIKVSEVTNPTEDQLMPLSTYQMEAVVDENGTLAFTGSGIVLQKPLYLNVKVTVPHKWGKLERTVQVMIKPNGK